MFKKIQPLRTGTKVLDELVNKLRLSVEDLYNRAIPAVMTKPTTGNPDITPTIPANRVVIYLKQASGNYDITNIIGATDSCVYTLVNISTSTTVTVKHNSSTSPYVYLAGGADWAGGAQDTLQLVYFDGAFYEISRSVNS